MKTIPAELSRSTRAARLGAAVVAAQGTGAALLAMRGSAIAGTEVGDQLKTAADLAAEGWILGYLRGLYPDDAALSEERYEADERAGAAWTPSSQFWIVDALDGTRSYADGFDTFCVQLAWIEAGRPVIGVVHEPVAGVTYLAAAGEGAFVGRRGQFERMGRDASAGWPVAPRFVDSTSPTGVVGAIRERRGGTFVECGSIGLKICRIADGTADVFAKPIRFKTWDSAPGELILAEAGGVLSQWDGERVSYGTSRVVFRNILAAPAGLFPLVAQEIADQQRGA